MSRTIFTGLLTLGLALAVGCGSKSEPPPSVPAEPGPTASIPAQPPGPAPSPDPNAGQPPKVEPPKAAWELDVDKHVIPATPVKGRIAGADVTPEVLLEGTELVLCTYKAGTPKDEPPVTERSVRLKLTPMLLPGQPAPSVAGRKWKMKFDAQPGPDMPQVWREVVGKDTYVYPPACALTLELGERKNGKISGKIYLSLDDDEKTVLAGTFEAPYVRPATELPGPDDVPYIGGTITVAGAKPNTEVRVGYAAFTEAGGSFPEFTVPFTSPAQLPPQPAKVGTSTFVPGDGATRPFRYEHVKLAPGRYLVTAAVSGGPVVWKWVDVPAGAALTENFALDAGASGGVEVTVPSGVTGMALVAPADDPKRPPLEGSSFQLLAILVARQGANVTGGKALVKNLAPGKYEVRVGDLRGTVDVVAGKTAELKLSPPKK
jgi:hypothetical protein